MPSLTALRRRQLALYVLSVGVLMMVLDTTVVTVALPTIETALGFSPSTLTWVLNAYLLTFGGCLLLGGRLGDLYGARRLFLAGIAIFTLASLACGLAHSQLELIAARAVQGIGGAVVSAVSLSLVMQLFTEPREWAAALFVWFVTAALYLQRVLGYDPLRIGLAFLPADSITAVLSVGFSARIVMRFGIRGPVAWGLALCAAGLALFAHVPPAGTFLRDVLPGMLLLGIGSGIGFNPLFLAAMSDVDSRESGLASGIVNTSFMMGGALGLAALTSLADARTDALVRAGSSLHAALTGGYRLAFGLGALLTALAAVLGSLALRPRAADAAVTPLSAEG